MDLPFAEKSWTPMMWRDFAIALSLSNLCFLSEWRWLLIPSHSFYYYHDKVPPSAPVYAGLAVNVLILAALFLIVARMVRRYGNETVKKCARILFVLTLSVPLYGLFSQLDNHTVRQLLLPFMRELTVQRLLFTVSITGALFVTLVALRKVRKAVKVATTVILILVPLVLITFSQAFFMAMKYGRLQPEALATPITAEGTRKNIRVVWFVFDEMDFRTAFSERPSNLVLPELDRLTGESLFASNPFPPAQETLLSMPALTTGKLVSSAHRVNPAELMIEFGDGVEAVPWSKESNIFSKAREFGFDTALIGWYHPYCRILGNSLTRCTWTGGLVQSKREQKPNRPALDSDWSAAFDMRSFARQLVRSIPVVGFILVEPDIASATRQIQLSKFNTTYGQAVEAATDPALGLVMVHWPIPHPPNIYNRSEKRVSTDPGGSYLDNLSLVDKTIGDIRRAMESKDNWKNTVVLITSDHWWRSTQWKEREVLTQEDQAIVKDENDRRVPFILKMTGDGSGLKYTEPFNTILTHDLLLAILRGEVVDTKGAAAWLDQHRTIARSPYDDRSSKDLF